MVFSRFVRQDSFLHGFPSPPAGKMWPSSDWALLERAGRGEREAVKEIVTHYFKPVHRFFDRVLRVPKQDTRDITQEFFAEFVRREVPTKLTHRKSFTSFMKVACRRFYINWLDKQRARQPEDAVVHGTTDRDGEAIDIAVPEKDFAEEFVAEQRAEVVRAAHRATQETLGKADQVEVFRGRYRLDGSEPESYASLAQRLGTPETRVRNLCTAVRKVFRRALWDIAAARSADAAAELKVLGLIKFVASESDRVKLPPMPEDRGAG